SKSRMSSQGSRVSRHSKIWIASVSGLILAQICATAFRRSSYQLSAITDLIQSILLFAAALFLAPNLARRLNRTPRTRLFWLLMMTGVSLWLSYQLLWTYFEVVLKKEVPNVFVGDIVLFLHLVPMMAAVALEPETRQDQRTSRVGTLDFALLLVWWVYLYLFAVIPWQYAYNDELAYSRNFNALYLTEKIAFLAGLVTLAVRSRSAWRKCYLLWFVAGALYACSSYIANWGIATRVYYTGSISC